MTLMEPTPSVGSEKADSHVPELSGGDLLHRTVQANASSFHKADFFARLPLLHAGSLSPVR